MFRAFRTTFTAATAALILTAAAYAQPSMTKEESAAKATAVVSRAVQLLGGDRYLAVKSQIGRGKYSVIRENAVASFQSFTDILVFPDKERTEFKNGSVRTTQVNTGSTGWIYDGENEIIKIQNEKQITDFKQSIRTTLDNILRGYWKGTGELSYIGRRPSTLGKRNEVVKVTYTDGFVIEYEFAVDDGTPQKAIYSRKNADGEDIKEEDRYAQFIDVGGVKSPFIIDHYSGGQQSSRVNYETVEFNKTIPESAFAKPSNPKDGKKEFKL